MPSSVSDFRVVEVETDLRLRVNYSIHLGWRDKDAPGIVLHHGICHAREHFDALIGELNRRGWHVAMIEQQSEHAGLFRNLIGANSYRDGMEAAVTAIRAEMKIGCYALHSMGAMIGEEAQQAYPWLRRPTILLAPVPVAGAWPITKRIMKWQPLNFLLAVLLLDIHSLAKTEVQVRKLFFDDQTPPEIVREATPRLRHAPFRMYLQLVLRKWTRPRVVDDQGAKLLLVSETDEIFHEEEYAETKRLYAKLETGRIPGGHDFFIQYADETAERMTAFIEDHWTAVSEPMAETRHSRRPETRHTQSNADRLPWWLGWFRRR